MRILEIAAGVLGLLGAVSIIFARQLGAFYEGGQVTMSDLGFVVTGMLLIGLGIVCLLIALIFRFTHR